MEIKIIGLGKMGLNLVANLKSHGHEVICFDINETARLEATNLGATATPSLEELFTAGSAKPAVYWSMLPSGKITEDMMVTCHSQLNTGDILIDGGNSKFADSIHHYHYLKEKGIHFLDVGTSGGMSGARNGACMMIGGDQAIFTQIEQLFSDLCVENGYLYCGEAGSGHYLKMVHNGIEYGMMQAIGEGFNLLHHSRFDYDLEQVARVFNNGSVVRSWLMELTENALRENPTMEGISGQVPSSGEGKWTVEEMLEMQQSAPVITQSLLTRYASMDTEKYGEKVIASLRNQFGGHVIPKG
ncbi:6-phosphogluconate dehydrogenase (decarboxylating) [Vagococcus penaei]|uniref:6-phosphogluconate dehydrogenase (Decarboxylating) n=1 Tax=Vagococcus penaei TaxID=633807 RepID=A0A1Q2D5R1_9ENTE|nr:decarboxylating 6-phosphogluconate dehydrogenase [Vagococcus penaei]AQP53587.1 6-phosphogluconate dehydrogenase (decarboxylating) [Vagococcus penaei]RSU07531.1 6-phosphogluconate dehydrogenase (decarboxylating) [Vagococcus penaei]